MPKELFVCSSIGNKKVSLTNVMVVRWTDKREVNTLSNFSPPVLRPTRGRFEVKDKPAAVVEYTRHMSGVDHLDQLISYFPRLQKRVKR